MKKSLMKKQNWVLVIIGVLVMYTGFFMASFITTNYDGLLAFMTVLTILAGLSTVIAGLALGFEGKNEPQ